MANTTKGAAVFLAVAVLVTAGAAPGAYAQAEPRTVQHRVVQEAQAADPLCLLIVATDIRTRAARVALATTGDEAEAVAAYRARLASLTERSAFRVIREKAGADPTPEAMLRAIEAASRACPAWAKKRAADPAVRGPILRGLALAAAKGRGSMFALGISDMFDHGVGGGSGTGSGPKGGGWSLDLGAFPDAGTMGAFLVALGTFLNAGAGAAGKAGIPSDIAKFYEGLGQAAIAAGTLMIGLDIIMGGGGRP